MDATTAPPRPRRRALAPAARARLVPAARLWGEVTLGGVLVLAAFAIWHLIRRGRRLRSRPGPPRPPERLLDPRAEAEPAP